MTVTLTLGQLANQVRVSTTASNSDVPPYYATILAPNLAAATEMVEKRAPDAPDDAQNKAVVQIVGYWMEAPPAAPRRFGYNVWQNSGAAQLLAPWIVRRADAV